MNTLSIFGGKGFIGSEFVRENKSISHVHERLDYVPVCPKILYLISTTHNYNIKINPFLDIQTNLTTLIRVLENSKGIFGKDVEFNFVSSWFVYGKTECPAKEDSYCNPNGFYSITKRAAEQLLMSYCETFGLKYRIFRLANVLGKNDRKISRKKNAFQYMVQQVALGNNIDYLYEGDFYRDFIDVRDVVKAIKLIMEIGEINSIYNVGNGKPYNINEGVYYANEVAGNKSKITLIDVPEFHKVVQVKDMWLDISKLESLGFISVYSIERMIKELVYFYAKSKITR